MPTDEEQPAAGIEAAAASAVPAGEPEAADEERRSATGVPLRPVLVVAALVLLALTAYGGYSCIRSAGSGSFSDAASRYPAGSVTYLANGRSYLVRRADGSYLALSEAEASATDRVSGCLIRFRPDLSAGGETGVFWDDCHGTLFSRSGIAVQGSSPPMQAHPVDTSNGRISVHLKQCLAAGSGQPEVCRI